jgi:hypothetical protein
MKKNIREEIREQVWNADLNEIPLIIKYSTDLGVIMGIDYLPFDPKDLVNVLLLKGKEINGKVKPLIKSQLYEK